MLRGYCKKCGSMIYEVTEEAYMPTSDVLVCTDCGEPNNIRRGVWHRSQGNEPIFVKERRPSRTTRRRQ